MSILTEDRIKKRLKGPKNRLVVTPILSPKQISGSSIDVRLGNQFIVFRMHMLGVFKPYNTSPGDLRKMQERQIVRFGHPFVLHPGMLALGSTFEYLSMPPDLSCYVEGRSSWARLGLQIATATVVEPCFKGTPTLELSNVGTIPIELYPGVRIAQLIFHDAEPPRVSPYGKHRKYDCPVGPHFSKVHLDEDGKIFAQEPE